MIGAPDEVSYEERRCRIEPALASLTPAETEQLLRMILQASFGDQTDLGYMLWYLLSLKKVIEQNFDRLMSIVRTEQTLQEQLICLLDRTHADPGPCLSGVIDCGLALTRKCKGEFQAILTLHRAAAKPILLDRLANGTPQQRMRSAEWLNKLYGKLIASALGEALSREQEPKVRAVIEPITTAYQEAEAYSQALAQYLALPPVVMPGSELPLPPKFAVRFQAFLQKAMHHSGEQSQEGLTDQAVPMLTMIPQTRIHQTGSIKAQGLHRRMICWLCICIWRASRASNRLRTHGFFEYCKRRLRLNSGAIHDSCTGCTSCVCSMPSAACKSDPVR